MIALPGREMLPKVIKDNERLCKQILLPDVLINFSQLTPIQEAWLAMALVGTLVETD